LKARGKALRAKKSSNCSQIRRTRKGILKIKGQRHRVSPDKHGQNKFKKKPEEKLTGGKNVMKKKKKRGEKRKTGRGQSGKVYSESLGQKVLQEEKKKGWKYSTQKKAGEESDAEERSIVHNSRGKSPMYLYLQEKSRA